MLPRTSPRRARADASCPLPPEPGYDRARPLLAWLLAGHALFTVVSKRTGDHVTAKVRRTRHAGSTAWSYYVYGRGGPQDPDADVGDHPESVGGPWFYIGQLFAAKDYVRVVATQATRARGAGALAAVNWFLERVHHGWDGTDGDVRATLRKSVKCARCKQLLTTPESIARGLGPECWGKAQGGV